MEPNNTNTPAPAAPATSAPTQPDAPSAPIAQPVPSTPAPATASAPIAQPAPATPAPTQPAAPVAPIAQPAPSTPTTAAAPVPAPTASAPVAQPAPTTNPTLIAAPANTTSGCKCPEVKFEDWDKKKTKIEKTFYRTFSPRILYMPFSFAIDINRAVMAATKKGYKEVASPMILDLNPGMFWSNVLVEVEGAKTDDPSVVSLAGKEVYTKPSRNSWNKMHQEIEELKKELGAAPKELYVWYTSCPGCTAKRDVKSVLIAVV